ncbi:putative leucine-rich repeat-containing protein DDB_G0290503 isoform X2 [Tenebrio molitor]
MDEDEINKFLDDILTYFVLLNRYVKQFDQIGAREHFTVRMALEVFLFVVDTTQIYKNIIKRYVKIVETVMNNYPKSTNIKEFFRIYSHLLDNVSPKVVQKIIVKHKSFPVLYEIVKTTCDVETQAIIIEVIFKLLKFNNNNTLQFQGTFPEVTKNLNIELVDLRNLYQNIRIVLDQLNDLSTNIFSINCSAIEIDGCHVIEFSEATTSNIWLDFNILQNKLSFFCDKKFLTSFSGLKFCTVTPWEVLSFFVKDVVDPTFNYIDTDETLEISLRVKSLLLNVKFDTIRNIKISISRYSNKFQLLVEFILPHIFSNSFSFDVLNIKNEKQNGDDSSTTDISLSKSDNDSSPIIEHFKLRKRKISVSNNDSLHVSSRLNCDNVIVVSDDSGDETVLQSGKLEKNIEENFDSVARVSVPLNDKSIINEQFKNENNKTGSKPGKISAFSRSERNIFNKSISPISFTESVLGRPIRPPSRNSQINGKHNKLIRHGKISTTNKEIVTSIINKQHLRISTLKENSKFKISSSLSSPVINKIMVLGKINDLEIRKSQQKNKKVNDVIIDEETAVQAIHEELLSTNENYSSSKVEDWLKTVQPIDTLEQNDEEAEIETLVERENLELATSNFRCNSNVTFDMTLEQEIEKLMTERNTELKEINGQDNFVFEEQENQELPKCDSVENLLNILSSQTDQKTELPPKDINEKEKSISKENSVINDSFTENKEIDSANAKTPLQLIKSYSILSNISSGDSDVPLSILAKKYKKMLNVTKKEHITDEMDAINELKNQNRTNTSHISLLPELEDKLTSLNTEHTQVPLKSAEHNENPTFVVPNGNELTSKKTKRTLYNPGDLSYLNSTAAEEYPHTGSNYNFTDYLPKNMHKRLKILKSKSKNNKVKKSNQKNTSRKNSGLQLTKNDITNVINENSVKVNTENKITFTKVFDSLKANIREHRKQTKIKKRLAQKNYTELSSSSSSMEPFGVALKNLRRKRKSSTLNHDSNTNLQRECLPLSENNVVSQFENLENAKKINIISNVLIQPGSSTPINQQRTSATCNCSEELVKMTTQFYLQFIEHVRICNPGLLATDECNSIVNILQNCSQIS